MSTAAAAVAVDAEHPWPGLMPFGEAAQRFFHGRDDEATELMRLIRRDTLTVLYGQSGLGKSSLLAAGLFPRLREADFLPVLLRIDWAASAPPPVQQVLAALVEACASHRVDSPAPWHDATLWAHFHRRDLEFWSPRNRLLTPVLVFDQFEELFTVGRQDAVAQQRAAALVDALADLVESRMPAALAEQVERQPELGLAFDHGRRSCKVVFAFREDYLPEFEGLRDRIRLIVHNRLRLQRMNGQAAWRAVRQPGSALVSDAVAEQIVRFVAAPRPGRAAAGLDGLDVEPALLSVVCRELNQQRLRAGGAQITTELLRDGAQQRIITDFYEASVRDVDPLLRAFVEDQLLTDSGYRDSVALEDALALPGVTREGIDQLIHRRLLHLEERSGTLRVELTHDLLTEVARASRDARKARAAQAAQQAQLRRIRQRQRRWIAAGVLTVAAAVGLTAMFAVLLRRAEDERERLLQTQSLMMLSRANAALEQGVGATPYAQLAAALALHPGNAAARARAVALLEQRRLPQAQGSAWVGGRPLLHWPQGAPLLVVQDGGITRVEPATTWAAPWQARTLQLQLGAVDHQDHGLAALTEGARQVLTAAARPAAAAASAEPGRATLPSLRWLPGAQLLAYLSPGRVLHLFDPVSLAQRSGGVRWPGPVATVAVDPERRWAAAQMEDGGLAVAALEDASIVAATRRGVGRLLAVGPGGDLLLHDDTRWRAVASDGRAWAEGDLQAVQPGALAQGPGGQIALADGNQVLLLDTRARRWRALPHPSGVRALAFSADGQVLATGALDRVARTWRTADGAAAGPPMRHQGPVLALAFDPADRRLLLSGAGDGLARLWLAERGELMAEPMVHATAVVGLAVQPGSDAVVSLGDDGRLTHWRRGDHDRAPRVQRGEAGALAVAWSARSGLLAQAWTGGRVAAFGPGGLAWQHEGGADVRALAFSPDGRSLVVSRADGSLHTLAGADGAALHPPRQSGVPLVRIVFNGTGTHWLGLASDGTLRQWRSTDGVSIGHALGGVHASTAGWDASGQIVVTADGAGLRLWSAGGLRPLARIALDGPPAWFGSAPGDAAHLWVLTPTCLQRVALAGPSPPPGCDAKAGALPLAGLRPWTAAIAPGGDRLAVGALDGRIRLVDLRSLRFIGDTARHDDAVLALRFSPDGTRLLSTSRDQLVRLWDVPGGTAIADPLAAGASVIEAGFSADGEQVLVVAVGGPAWLQRIGRPLPEPDAETLADLLCLAGRSTLAADGEARRLADDEMLAMLRRLHAPVTADPATAAWVLSVAGRLATVEPPR